MVAPYRVTIMFETTLFLKYRGGSEADLKVWPIGPNLSFKLSHVEDWDFFWHQWQISFGVTNPDFYYILEHIKKWFLSKMLLVNNVPYFSIWNVYLILPVFRLPEPDFRFAISGSGNANSKAFLIGNNRY